MGKVGGQLWVVRWGIMIDWGKWHAFEKHLNSYPEIPTSSKKHLTFATFNLSGNACRWKKLGIYRSLLEWIATGLYREESTDSKSTVRKTHRTNDYLVAIFWLFFCHINCCVKFFFLSDKSSRTGFTVHLFVGCLQNLHLE